MAINRVDSNFVENKSTGKTVRTEIDEIDLRLDEITISVTHPPSPLVGAVADGVTDDSQALFNIHEYANENNYSVNYGNNSYFIGSCLNIPIKTSTNFGSSKLIINEASALHGFQGNGYFNIRPTTEMQDITNEVKNDLLAEWNRNAKQLNSLVNYPNHYVIVEDENDILVERSTSGQQYVKKDQTILREDGKVLSDLCFNFIDFTSIKVKTRETSYIEISGGNFLFNGKRSTEIGNTYRCPIFFVERSKVKMKNMVVDLLDGTEDLSGQASMGLFRTKNIDDFEAKDVKFLPRESSGIGNYGFMFTESINCRLDSIEGDKENTWGVMQSEYLKDFYVNNSRLNRIDAHIWGYNFYITNSEIGEHGSTLYGGGDLYYNNVIGNNTRNYISLRSDYGTTWDGDLRIRDSKLKIKGSTSYNKRIVFSNIIDYDFQTDINIFSSVNIDGFEIEFTDEDNEDLIYIFDHTGTPNNNVNAYFADNINIKNVKVKGREKGVIALEVGNAGYLKSRKSGNSGNIEDFTPNSYVYLESIDTNPNENSIHWTDAPINPNGADVFPKISAKNVDVRLNTYNSTVYFEGDNIIFRRHTAESGSSSIIDIKNSKIIGILLDGENNVFSGSLASKLGHFKLEDCVIGFPYREGVPDETLNGMNSYSIFMNNRFRGWVKGCRFTRNVITSQVFQGMGQGGSMSHNAYVKAFEEAAYSRRNSDTIMPTNDAPPLDGLFHTRGTVIWNEYSNPLGWKVVSSGLADENTFSDIL